MKFFITFQLLTYANDYFIIHRLHRNFPGIHVHLFAEDDFSTGFIDDQ